jgi:hypothetical protein
MDIMYVGGSLLAGVGLLAVARQFNCMVCVAGVLCNLLL